MADNNRSFSAIVGLALVGGSITGIASLLLAFVALLSGEFPAAAISLAASALSFGLLASAVLRR